MPIFKLFPVNMWLNLTELSRSVYTPIERYEKMCFQPGNPVPAPGGQAIELFGEFHDQFGVLGGTQTAKSWPFKPPSNRNLSSSMPSAKMKVRRLQAPFPSWLSAGSTLTAGIGDFYRLKSVAENENGKEHRPNQEFMRCLQWSLPATPVFSIPSSCARDQSGFASRSGAWLVRGI